MCLYIYIITTAIITERAANIGQEEQPTCITTNKQWPKELKIDISRT